MVAGHREEGDLPCAHPVRYVLPQWGWSPPCPSRPVAAAARAARRRRRRPAAPAQPPAARPRRRPPARRRPARPRRLRAAPARRRPERPAHPRRVRLPRRLRASLRSRATPRWVWSSTSAAGATSRSTTPPTPAWTKAVKDLGVTEKELAADAGESDNDRERGSSCSRTRATTRSSRSASSYDGAVDGKIAARTTRTPSFAIIDDVATAQERRRPDLRRGAGLLPRRRGGRAQDQDRHGRLHRRRRRAADARSSRPASTPARSPPSRASRC